MSEHTLPQRPAKEYRCPDHIHGIQEDIKDEWRKRGHDTVCSYCGSMSWEDFKRCMREALDPETSTTIEPSMKGYKIYVHRKEVPHAGEAGSIKFYTWHIPESKTVPEENELHRLTHDVYVRAVQASNEKIRKRQEEMGTPF